MSERFAEGQWADDLSWIVGRLRQSELEGGYWTLEFGPEDAPLGGRVLLGRPDELAQMSDGELVRIEGAPDELGVSIFMDGTPYELRSVERVTS